MRLNRDSLFICGKSTFKLVALIIGLHHQKRKKTIHFSCFTERDFRLMGTDVHSATVRMHTSPELVKSYVQWVDLVHLYRLSF